MPNQYPPVAYEAYFDQTLHSFDYYEHPYPIADTSEVLVGSAPYFATPDDGSYHEATEKFLEDKPSGLVFTGEWAPEGAPIDIAVDWRVFVDAPDGGTVDIVFQCTGLVDVITFGSLPTPGWHSGTTYLSELGFLDAPAIAAAFFNFGAGSVPRVGVAPRPTADGTPDTENTKRVDYIRVYLISPGGIPLRLMQRGDGLGMGSGHILGTNTRQSSTRLFGAL